MILTFSLATCAAPPRMEDAVITVEGSVSVRGNEPFTAVLMETDQGNSYVLVLDDDQRTLLQDAAPGTFRVTGVLFKGTWNNQPYAHLRVQTWEEIQI